MTRHSFRAALAAMVAIVLAPAGSSAVNVAKPPVPHAAGVASAASTLISLTTDASGTIELARDQARSTAGSAPNAYALLVAGAAADQTVGHAEGESKSKGDKQGQSISDNGYSIPGLVDVHLTNASVATDIGDDVTSDVVMNLGKVDVLHGFATIDGGVNETHTLANDTLSRVRRTVSISGLHTFSLLDLLRAMNASPLDLNCSAVEQLGVAVGVDTAQACAQLAGAQSAVSSAKATLSGTATQLTTAKNDVLGQVAVTQQALGAQTANLSAQQQARDAAAAQLAAAQQTLNTDTTARNALQTQLSALQAQRDALIAQTAGLDRAFIQTQRDARAAVCPTLVVQALIDACNQEVVAYDAELALFAQLDTANAAVLAKIVQVDAAVATVASDNGVVATFASVVASLDAAIASINSVVDALQATLAQLNSDLDGLITALALVDPLASVQATCKTVSDAMGAAANQVAMLTVAATSAKQLVDEQCATIATTLDDLVSAPLVTLDGVDIHVDAIAKADHPSVVVSGTIGRVQVGNLAPVGVDLDVVGAQIGEVQQQVQFQLDAIMGLTGLSMPLPEFQFMVTDGASGKDAGGNWFAHGSVTALRIHMPVETLNLPPESPMGVVDNGSAMFAPASTTSGAGAHWGSRAGARGAHVALASTPGITFNLGTFTAGGTFKPASNVGPKQTNGGGPGSSGSSNKKARGGSHKSSGHTTQYVINGHPVKLPHTGVGTARQALLGLVLLFGACLLARKIVVAR